jgi:hypothetical protein
LGDGSVPPEPEAQGPALDAEGKQRAGGPFAWSRHPLNFAPVILFWLTPRMTTNHLAFSAAATAYLVLGSLHEETRLRQAYGVEYAAYQNSGARFYLPRLGPNGRRPLEQLLPPAKAGEATGADLPARLARPAGDR